MPEEKGESLQTAFPLYILAEGRDIVDGKRIGVLMECSGAERNVGRMTIFLFLMPIRASLLTTCLA